MQYNAHKYKRKKHFQQGKQCTTSSEWVNMYYYKGSKANFKRSLSKGIVFMKSKDFLPDTPSWKSQWTIRMKTHMPFAKEISEFKQWKK